MTAQRATANFGGWLKIKDLFAAAPRIWNRRSGGLRAVALAFWCVVALGSAAGPVLALDAIVVKAEDDRVEITAHGELYDNQGDRFQVETAAGRTGVAGRMTVAAQITGTNPSWLVFALTNPTGGRIERWLTADRYAVVGSGAVWPDLDARRIEAVTPSIGFLPEKLKSDRADVYRVTIEPGQTVTFVAELSSERYARVYLWKPLAYELKVRERQLFNGVLLGLTGLLAIFLTAIFAANHKVIFPSAALVSWCVLAYLCIEFGFFHKLFNLSPEDNAIYRAAGEASIAASLVLFLYTFLRLGLGHSIVRMLFGVWILAQLALVAVAAIDPRLAATFARLSFFLIGVVGTVSTIYLTFKGQDRAISLIPTWILFLVWVFGAAVILTGRLSGEVAVAALVAGLVLVVVLIGFTVTQFAFRSLQPLYGSSAQGEEKLRSLAVDGAGAATWEWNDRRNEVRVSPIIEAALGLNVGELSTKVDDFIAHINPNDRDRFRLMLWSIQERGGGQIRIDFRLRASDNSYLWFELEAASMETADRRSIRCVGLLRDINDAKRSQERLLHDAVHCSLTGLPNREIFIDRLSVAMQRAASDDKIRPTVLFVDMDKFKSINKSLGLVVGDSLLLTVARRLQRHLDGHDTLARLNGDQFAILLLSEQEPRALAARAERIRRSLRSPIKIAGREVVLTGSIGIAIFDGEEESHLDLLKEAEIAMYQAKRSGADRIEIFNSKMRSERDDKVTIESDLRTALRKNQIKILFQPIVYLPTEELAGFEALVRWEHPTRGLLNPDSFIPVAEESDLIVRLGSYVLNGSVETLCKWQKILPRSDAPLFLSVNISSRQLMGTELISEVKQITSRSPLKAGSLRLEITESLVMGNPEQAVERMEQIRASGAELALDDFGTGYSSLAYLQRFPVDTIKLDRSFVQSSHDSDRAQSAIVRSMVALAHELGKSVVAEGVEEPQDAAFLRSIGCEYAQGFYYGEAMSESESLELLRIIRKSERKLETQGFFRPRPKKSKGKVKDKIETKPPTKEKPKVSPMVKAGGSNGSGGASTPAIPPNHSKNKVPTPPPNSGARVANNGQRRVGDPAVTRNGSGPNPAQVPPPTPTPRSSPGAMPPIPNVGPPSIPTTSNPQPPVAAPRPGSSPGQKPVNGPHPRVPPPGQNPSPLMPSAAAPVNSAIPPVASAVPQVVVQVPENVANSDKLGAVGSGAALEGSGSPLSGMGIGGLLDGLPPLPAVDPEGSVADKNTKPDLQALNAESTAPVSGNSGEKPVGGKIESNFDAAEISSLPPGIAASLARLAGSTSGSKPSGPRRLSEGGSVPRPQKRRSTPEEK